jgi:uroporphyrinogen III methyltransferase/synthase
VTTAPPDNTAAPTGAPLSGRSVIVTRTLAQAHTLVEPLEALGAEVLAFPVLETVDPEDFAPLDAAIADLASYDWVVLTSTNGVDRFLKRFRAVKGSRDAILGAKFAAVGSATAEKLAKHGLPPALVPQDFRAEGLVEAFREMGAGEGCKVLIPRAEEAREVLPDELRAMGCQVDVVYVYRTRLADPNPETLERLRAGSVDVVTFTSGAIARGFVLALDVAGLDAEQVFSRLIVASIGPVTSDAIREIGLRVDVEAPVSTMASLVDAVAGQLSGNVSPP